MWIQDSPHMNCRVGKNRRSAIVETAGIAGIADPCCYESPASAKRIIVCGLHAVSFASIDNSLFCGEKDGASAIVFVFAR